MANNLATTKKQGIASYLGNEAVKNQITSIIGEKATPTFISSIVSAVQTNPALAECTNSSILSGALLGESLHLTPSPQLGEMYLVPFENRSKGCKEATFQLGYKGMIQLAIRSGQYKRIVASEVKEGEIAGYNPLTEEFVINPIMDIAKRKEMPTVGYYAMFELVNGYRKELYWTKDEMENHAITYSKGYKAKKGYTFWEKNFDAMAKKTMLRQLISKWGVMSAELQTGYLADQSVVREDGSYDYVDNKPDAKLEAETNIEESVAAEVFDVEAVEVENEEKKQA